MVAVDRELISESSLLPIRNDERDENDSMIFLPNRGQRSCWGYNGLKCNIERGFILVAGGGWDLLGGLVSLREIGLLRRGRGVGGQTMKEELRWGEGLVLLPWWGIC